MDPDSTACLPSNIPCATLADQGMTLLPLHACQQKCACNTLLNTDALTVLGCTSQVCIWRSCYAAGAASCQQGASPTTLTPVAEASESQELGRRLPPADMPPTQPQQQLAEAEEDITKLVSAEEDAGIDKNHLIQGPLHPSVEQ